MKFDPPLIKATLLKRYKRFLADIMLEDGKQITVHCPNPGAMAGLKQEGNTVWISDSNNPARKLRHTWEIVEADQQLVGINTNRANTIAREALDGGLLPFVETSTVIRPEQRYGENSRIDFLLENPGSPSIFVEVKSVTFKRQAGLHEFPDGVTARGAKHLDEMMREIDRGNRAVMLFIIQRNDGDRFQIADDIDSAYGERFQKAIGLGMEAYAVICKVTPEAITPEKTVTVLV